MTGTPKRLCDDGQACSMDGCNALTGCQRAIPAFLQKDQPMTASEAAERNPPLLTRPKPKINLYDFLRAGAVKRWTIIETAREQRMAEHGFLQTLIAIELYHDIVGCREDGTASEMLQLVMACLFHDMPETRTGDLPTPAKKYIREKAHGSQANLPASQRVDLFADIDFDLMPEIPYIGGTIPLALQDFIKMADDIEASHFITDWHVGEHARLVAERMRIRMERRVAEITQTTGVDWYGPVNRVLMALGDKPVHKDTEVRAL